MPLHAPIPLREEPTVMTIREFLASVVRTLVPGVVGLVTGALLAAGIDVDETALQLTISGVMIGAYYSAIRVLEARWPWLGTLLGWKAAPHYDDETKTASR